MAGGPKMLVLLLIQYQPAEVELIILEDSSAFKQASREMLN